MKYALIGCGRISTSHIKAATQNQLEIVALCDIDASKMDAVIAKHGLENVQKFTSHTELISAIKPDLVAIATESGRDVSKLCHPPS